MSEEANSRNPVLRIVAYVLSTFLFLGAGATILDGEVLPGTLMALIAFSLLPLSWDVLAQAVGRTVPIGFRIAAVVLLVFGLGAVGQAHDTRTAAQEADARAAEAEARAAERRADFALARDSLLNEASALHAKGEFDAIIRLATSWQDVGDEGLERARADAEAAKTKAAEEVLVRRARSVSASDTEENLSIYRELVSLIPDNDTYRASLRRYEEVAREEERQQRERRALAAKWDYHSSEDQMTGRITRSARIRSENTVNFSFPYQGAQRATLTLRQHPTYGRDVIFRIERGQLLCHTFDRCDVRVRFDDGQSQLWRGAPPADHSTEIIFLRNYDTFVQRLRSSRVVRIQPGVYQEGNPVFEFHVGGFDFDRYRGR
jgi:hypothetical protein